MDEEAIKVKEEPLDSDNEYEEEEQLRLQQEQQQQEAMLEAATAILPTATTIKVEDELIIKTECDFEELLSHSDTRCMEVENMSVVDEQPDLITVNAVDQKSEDEKTFIDCLTKKNIAPRQRKRWKYEMTCSKCAQIFHVSRVYEEHVKFGLCAILENKLKCAVCPLSFGSQEQLDSHLELHKMNRFFCAKHCGLYFDTIEQCELHEYSEHDFRNILCTICNHKFSSCADLVKHFQSSHSSLKRFVCSFCREWFSCSIDLAKHWQENGEGCGQLMQDVVRETMETIESSLPAFKSVSPIFRQAETLANKKRHTTTDTEKSKRRKVVAKDSCESNSSVYLSLNDIQIKEEPNSGDEDGDGDESMQTNATSSSASQSVAIKSEAVEGEIQIKEEPLDDDLAGPQLNVGKPIIPINISTARGTTTPSIPLLPKLVPCGKSTIDNPSGIVHNIPPTLAMSNVRVVRLPVVQSAQVAANATTTLQQIPSLKQFQIQNPNLKVSPINMSGVKIFKIVPETKLLRFQIKTDPTTSSGPTLPITSKPIVVKLKNPPVLANVSNINPTSTSSTLKSTSTPSKSCTSKCTLSTTSSPPQITLKLKSLETNTTIDAEDLQKLVDEAKNSSSRVRRNMCRTKSELQKIESEPQKRALIEVLKREIQKYDSSSNASVGEKQDNNEGIQTSNTASGENPENNDSTIETSKSVKVEEENSDHNYSADLDDDDFDEKSLIIDEDDHENNSTSSNLPKQSPSSEPTSFMLKFTTDCDPELMEARKKYPNHRYYWLCPKCPRQYAQKHSFRSHLVGVHGFCKEDFDNLIVEVKSQSTAKTKEETQELERLRSESETDSVVTSVSAASAETQPPSTLPTKRRKSAKFTCVKCGRMCSTRTALTDHVLANCSREPHYPCPTCPKKFYSASTLNSHLSIHTGALPHKCNYCDKRFRTRGQVTVHHRTHTGERPFTCQICSQSFTHRETLISHLSRHIGMKRYKCYGCNQQFACISGLKTHREVRFETCGKVKLNTRAIGPRVRVIKGNVIFEAQPDINPYLRTENPEEVLAEINQNKTS